MLLTGNKGVCIAFFVLIPFYWLASILIYAASSHQQITPLNDKRAMRTTILLLVQLSQAHITATYI